jgi:hypothetical protein
MWFSDFQYYITLSPHWLLSFLQKKFQFHIDIDRKEVSKIIINYVNLQFYFSSSFHSFSHFSLFINDSFVPIKNNKIIQTQYKKKYKRIWNGKVCKKQKNENFIFISLLSSLLSAFVGMDLSMGSSTNV